MNSIDIKTYEIDYSFIINNYLDKELWHKEWTLFVYKNFVFSLSLYSIDTRNDAITFKVSIKNGSYTNWDLFTFFLQQSNLSILKKQINGCVFNLITWCEEYHIRKEEGYQRILEAESTEEEILEEVATSFLDENNVTNNEIRQVYIENYIDKNKKTDTYLSNYIYNRRYHVLSDLFLIYTKVADDKTRYNNVENAIRRQENYPSIMKEVNEYIELLSSEDEEKEELITELRSNLEAI